MGNISSMIFTSVLSMKSREKCDNDIVGVFQ